MWGSPGAAIGPLSIVVFLFTVAAGAVARADESATAAGAPAARPADRSGGVSAMQRGKGGPVLTESDALRLGLADAAFQQLQDARVDVARSDVVEAGLPPNPELELSYESADGAGDPSDTKLRLSQTFDTSGRPACDRRPRRHGSRRLAGRPKAIARSARRRSAVVSTACSTSRSGWLS